ncbi:MAG: c-type cytochrome [Vicinamibacterales bacterium]
MNCHLRTLLCALIVGTATACSNTTPSGPPALRYKLAGPLIPSHMTMVTAWDFPQNPLTDPSLDGSTLSTQVQWGFRLFTNTPAEAPQLVGGEVSCSNCHLNGGQRERAMPLVAIATAFPEYNRRAGHLISLNDRIVDCFLRSENATSHLASDGHEGRESPDLSGLPDPTSKEVLAIAAYLTWLSRGYEIGRNPTWRGQNAIPKESLIPIDRLDAAKGEALYLERCTSCHGEDGQGVYVGDKRPGPLWGPLSWNDGAGAARTYTLAGIIRYSMPYLDPGSLTDEEAQHLAAFITSKPRPVYPLKDRDYLADPLPVDAVYYPKRPPAAPAH